MQIVTVAERHGVKQEGLRKFEKILNHFEKIRLYFVVPKERFETYKKQNYLDGNKKAENVIR